MVVAASSTLAFSSHAAMQLDRTRLVVNEADARAVLQIHSADRAPILLQIWVDEATAQGTNSQDTSALSPLPPKGGAAPPAPPFLTDPPMLVLDPGQSRAVQVLRVTAPETLSADRESLWWLNVLEIPAVADDAASDQTPDANRLHLSVQSRLKLHYRPQALAHYRLDALPEREQLHFTVEHDATDDTDWLVVENPAPLYQTLAELTLTLPDGSRVALPAPMLAPFATTRLALPQQVTAAATPARLVSVTVSENGNPIPHEQAL